MRTISARPAPARQMTGEKRGIRFLKHWQVYYPGDCATWPVDIAARLVDAGLAEEIDFGKGPPPPDAEYALRYPIELSDRRDR